MRLWLVWMLCVLLSLSATARAVDPQVNVADIVQPLEQAEKRVHSLAVNANFDILHRFFPGEEYRDVTLTSIESIIVDREGRCRVQIDTQSFRKLGTSIEMTPKVAIGTFDGKVARVMEGQARMSSGAESSLRSEVPLRLDPRNLTTHYFFKPISELLARRGAQVIGEETWNGNSVIVVETIPFEGEDRRKFRFFLDPQRGLTVVRRAIAIQYPPYERWMEYSRIEGFDYEQIAPDVWLPGRVVYESFDPTVQHSKDGSEPPLSWRWKVNFENWRVNEDYPPETFELKFAPGVLVNDRTTGRSFTVPRPESQ